MVSNNKRKGDVYEQLALDFLLKNKLSLIEKNFHSRFGEIDLIMLDQDQVVFTEVRFRQQKQFGSALESVNLIKQQRLITTAKNFLQQRSQFHQHSCRFDVIAIELDSREQAQYDWVKSAFTE